MRKFNYLLLLLFIFLSCKSQNSEQYIFDPKTISENTITLSEIADDISYIPLDNSYPLNDIHNPRFSEKSIFFFSNNGIIAFTFDGKNSTKIGIRGRGPDEYLSGLKFAIDSKNETIYVLNLDKQIKTFSIDGKYKRSISLSQIDGSPSLIEIYDSKIFISFNLQFDDSQFEWIILDTIGNIIKTKKRFDSRFTSNFGPNSGTYVFNKKLHYWNPYLDTVISIRPDLSYNRAFILKAGEHRLPRYDFNPSKPPHTFMHLRNIFETSRFWVIRYDYIRPIIALIDKRNRKSYLSYLDQNSKSNESGIPGGLLNDYDGGINFEPRSYFSLLNEEYMVGLINPNQLIAHVASSKFSNYTPHYPAKKKELEKLTANMKETDNLVLMIVKLKK